MQEQNGLNPAQRELEAALEAMIPTITRADPIAAAFTAGTKLGRRRARFWQTVTAITLAVGIGIHFAPITHNYVPASSSEVHGTTALLQPPSAPTRRWLDQSLLMLQKAVDNSGVDALPAPRPAPVRAIGGSEIL